MSSQAAATEQVPDNAQDLTIFVQGVLDQMVILLAHFFAFLLFCVTCFFK